MPLKKRSGSADPGMDVGFLPQVPRLCFTHVERVANLSLDHYRENRFRIIVTSNSDE